jgi:hypothetical protein
MWGRKMNTKSLSPDAIYAYLKENFSKLPEHRTNLKNIKISLADALMSALAMFSIKSESLLEFDRDMEDEIKRENIRSLFNVKNVPCDTQMREILDPVNPEHLRKPFKDLFSMLQRGGHLKPFTYFKDHYIMAGDGTGFYSSTNIMCPHCLIKKVKGGDEDDFSYHHQLFAAAIVSPLSNIKQVIPLYPEAIINQDGNDKNDCERNACIRFLTKFREDHPQLKVVIVLDALFSNAPLIRHLNSLNIRYIIVSKEGDTAALFKQFDIK